MALWWVPVGHEPTVEEAKAKLTLLERLGPGRRTLSRSSSRLRRPSGGRCGACFLTSARERWLA